VDRDTVVLVPAAGRGERLGAGVPKALCLLAGEPLLRHAVRRIAAARSVAAVVVAVPADQVDAVRALLGDLAVAVTVVAGGATRQASVGAALAAAPPALPIVLVHDAARCLAPTDLVDTVADAVRSGQDAVVPVLPVLDTVKAVDPDGVVVATVDRAPLRAVQTPQGFQRSVLVAAHAAADPTDDPTDDAGMVERLGTAVRTVSGSEEAFKVTRPIDLVLAEALLARTLAGPP